MCEQGGGAMEKLKGRLLRMERPESVIHGEGFQTHADDIYIATYPVHSLPCPLVSHFSLGITL
jgi:hypothetical protein